MAEEDKDQKTEDPTGKRLDEAREHGQIPVSRETTLWVAMLGMLTVVGLAAPVMMRNMAEFLRGLLETLPSYTLDENNIQPLFAMVGTHVALICGVVFLLLGAGAILGVMAQTGFFFALDLLAPDLMRLNPARGLQRFFSLNSLVELGKSLAKMAIMGGVAFSVLWPVAVAAPGFVGMPFDGILQFIHKKAVHLLEMLLLAFTVIAATDLFYTRWKYIRDLRMSKTEVKDEMKQQEGDPMIKGRLRGLRMERARKRMMAQVPKADVVITNPTHYAIALKYDNKKMQAPVVVAKGINLIAERIRDLAEQSRVPLVSNPPLSRALYEGVEIDQSIPAEHYRAVAEVISYVYKLRKRKF